LSQSRWGRTLLRSAKEVRPQQSLGKRDAALRAASAVPNPVSRRFLRSARGFIPNGSWVARCRSRNASGTDPDVRHCSLPPLLALELDDERGQREQNEVVVGPGREWRDGDPREQLVEARRSREVVALPSSRGVHVNWVRHRSIILFAKYLRSS